MSNYDLPEKDDAPWLNCMDGFNTSRPIRPELSTAAQAVWKAYYSTNDDLAGPALAAALRAATDQLTPFSVEEMYGAAVARNKLRAIADELEGIQYGTYRCELD